jgi:hypothetical protein
MHPIANLTVAVGVIVLSISVLFIITGAELPIGEASDPDDSATKFAFSGVNGTLFFDDSLGTANLGWAAYVFGDYVDLDENGMWDSCQDLEVLVWSEDAAKPPDFNHTNNTFNPLCEIGSERAELVNQSLVYVGQICHHPLNESESQCSSGNYSLESNDFIRLVEEQKEPGASLLSGLLEMVVGGIRTGYTSMCCSLLLLTLGAFLGMTIEDEEENSTVKKSGPKAEWRAYALSQSERGADGLPKSFSRHLLARNQDKKPRKGNLRGGVHQGGGLFLGGWTEEDSDQAYKKKVKDKRE